MAEIDLYLALEEMVKAAERNDREAVRSVNEKFSALLVQEFAHLSSTAECMLKYDRCANSAAYSVIHAQPERDEHLVRMRERFSAIPKPK